MPFPRSTALRTLSALVLALAWAGAARATSISSHTVVFEITLEAATYEDDGTDAFPDGFGFRDETVGTFEAGTASQSGSSSFTINGFAPSDPQDFPFFVGDTLVATIQADTSAAGLGSQATHLRDLLFNLEFEDFSDGTRNILLDFSWSYTQSFTLTNMAAGDQSAVFLDASVLVSNFESYSDGFSFVTDENYGNFQANTWMTSFGDSGGFQLLMDVEGGGATASLVEILLEVGANNIIEVPEPRAAALLLAPLLFVATRHRRRR